jgi:uncharacterized protein (TIGR02600 family)
MPIVEPYPISEPFSTAGKINLNYQLMPFGYIRRQTAILALLKNEMITAIPNTASKTYKTTATQAGFRLPINLDSSAGTLKGFEQRFASGEIFRSASEICDIHLVPQGTTYGSLETGSFWRDHKLTGDNSRERPYTHIYPRLTTKSNSYTVHVRVQALKKLPTGSPDQWIEGRDQVLSEYRGSSLIERYIDPNDPRLPDFAGAPTADDNGNGIPNADEIVDPYYRFRIISTKKFAP